MLRQKGIPVKLNALHFYAASQHAYEQDWKDIEGCLNGEILGEYAPINLDDFNDYDDLVAHLWNVARFDVDKGFLCELQSWKG